MISNKPQQKNAFDYLTKDSQCRQQPLTACPQISSINQLVLVSIYMLCSRGQYVWGGGWDASVWRNTDVVAFTVRMWTQLDTLDFPIRSWGLFCLQYSLLFCTSVLTQASLPVSISVSSTPLCFPVPHVSALLCSSLFTFRSLLPFLLLAYS